MTLDEIKIEIEKLDDRAFNELRFWMSSLDDTEVDHKLREAIGAGAFDAAASKADTEYRQGKSKALPTEADVADASNVA